MIWSLYYVISYHGIRNSYMMHYELLCSITLCLHDYVESYHTVLCLSLVNTSLSLQYVDTHMYVIVYHDVHIYIYVYIYIEIIISCYFISYYDISCYIYIVLCLYCIRVQLVLGWIVPYWTMFDCSQYQFINIISRYTRIG